MRKGLLCLPMMTLLLLSGCAGGGESRQAEELALTIRGEWLETADCTAAVDVTADYGQRVCRYEMDLTAAGEEIRLVVTSPERVAGIAAHASGEDGFLEYDGLVLETGPLDKAGLDPVSAVPALLRTIRSGYMVCCGMEDSGLLRVDYGQPEAERGTGTEYTIWFDPADHAPERGEILSDGVRVVSCIFTDFTRG